MTRQTDITPETLAIVARALFGVPDPKLSDETRLIFGAIEFNCRTGVFYDREAEDAVGVMDLVQKHLGPALDRASAERWLGRFLQNEVFVEAADLPPELMLERDLVGLVLAVGDRVTGIVEEEIGPTDFMGYLHSQIYAACIAAFDGAMVPTLGSIVEVTGRAADEEVFPGFTLARYVAYLMRAAPTQIDAADVAAGVTLADLARGLARRVRQIAGLARGEIGSDIAPDPEPPAPRASEFGLVMWADQNQPGPQYEYLIEDLIPENELVLVMGEKQSGKSFFTMDMGISGARGVHFFDRRVLRPFGVVYCAYEAGQGYKNRMRAYTAFHGLKIADIPFGVLTKPIDLWSQAVNTERLIDEIQWIAREKFPGVRLGAVVIDTHNAATPGASEIDSKEVSLIRDRYRKIMAACQSGVWVVGHKNAAGKHRGNEQLVNNIDTVIDISRKVEHLDNRTIAPVRDAHGTPIRTARVVYQREGQDSIGWEFVLGNVEIGQNAFGRPRTSCVVLAPAREVAAAAQAPGAETAAETAPASQHTRRPLNADELVILQAIKDAASEYGVDPHATPGMPKELTQLPRSIVSVVEWGRVRERYRLKVDPGLSDEAFDKRLSRAGTMFLARRIIGRINPYVWVIPKRNGSGTYPPPAAARPPEHHGEKTEMLPLLAPGETRGDDWSDVL